MAKKVKKNKNVMTPEEQEMENKINQAMAKIVQDTAGNNTAYDKPKKSKKVWKAVGVTSSVVVIGAAIAYGAMAYYYSDKFFKGTSINNINCENLTVSQVEELIGRQIEEYKITLNFKDEKAEDILGKDIDYSYVPNGEIQKLLDDQPLLGWAEGYFFDRDFEVKGDIVFDEEKLRNELESMYSMQESNQEPPQDAYVDFQDAQFVVVDAVEGTTIDEDTLFEALESAVAESKTELSVEETGSYEQPQVLGDSEELIAERDMFNEHARASITYTFGDETVVLDGMTIKDWLSFDENGKPVANEKEFKAHVTDYVKELAATHDTVGKERQIKSSSTGEMITVKGGSYGWKINQKKEVEQLLKDIKAGEITTREPVYSSTALYHGEDEIGNTYVEVDLGAQHLWFYKDGNLVVDSEFVSGNMAYKDRVTPGGIYDLDYKQKDKVLRGRQQPDGSYEYESPVTYWMPFNGGIGFHDASWRSKFGGSIYKTSGSHGCINMPGSKAKQLYQNIEKGTPVICFY